LSKDAFVTATDLAQLEAVAATADEAVIRQRVFALIDERLSRRERLAG
jgi:hypothetical protein